MTNNDLQILCQCAISAALQAGKVIQEYANKQYTVKTKKDAPSLATQVVTEVDFKSQEIILKSLQATSEIYNLALLTEESTDDKSRFEKEFFWCIDPLDGTLPFTESKPGYAVSIALVARDGTPLIGVVYDPLNDTLYHAIKGFGAFKNSQPFKSKQNKTSNTLHVFFDRSFFTGTLFEATKIALNRLFNQLNFEQIEIRQAGGSVVSALQVIENAQACYFKYPREADSGGSLWDYAATSCIFQELNLVATDIYGKPMELNRESSTFMNHKGFIFASTSAIAKEIMLLYQKLHLV